MLVSSLRLSSFRGFDKANLSLDPRLTLLVGRNGAGKTTLLDAASVLLSQVHASIVSRVGRGPRFNDGDINDAARQTECSLTADFGGGSISWMVAHARRGLPPTASQFKELAEVVAEVQSKNERGDWALPLAVRYGVSRAPAIPQRIREHHQFGPLSAYDSALIGGAGASFRQFFEWFREREDLENEVRLRPDSTGKRDLFYEDRMLAVVRRAVARIVPGFSNLRIERDPQRMIVDKEQVPFEIGQLSDGERGLIALAGDLARRLALANPSTNDPLICSAVVMIDEVDLHLHPGWQRVVVERLQRTFPNCQFILTTHSPQVVASVPTASIRLLRNFEIEDAPVPVEGRDTNAILRDLFGERERPEWAASELSKVVELIDGAELSKARQKLTELSNKLTQADSEVVRLTSLIRFLEES